MNSVIDVLNIWGDRGLAVAWPMLWQSSALIGLLVAIDFLFRRKLRPSVRYALWLTLLLKLLLPPSLALPSGVGWWVCPSAVAAGIRKPPQLIVTSGLETVASVPPEFARTVSSPRRPPMTLAAWGLVAASCPSLGMLGWMLVRWRQASRDTQQTEPTPDWLGKLVQETCQSAGLRRPLRLRMIARPVSPAVCGLVRPVVLLPRTLVEQLTAPQLRAILLHEAVHIRRGDVWINFVQTLLQVVYWWHPLLWLANARIRRAREEAVDDAVMLALRDDAEGYAATLVQVAKLVLDRQATSLGLVGILESASLLRRRIERLIDFQPPRNAGLTVTSAMSVMAFGAFALPMGQAPARQTGSEAPAAAVAPASAPRLERMAPAAERQTDQAAGPVRNARILFEIGKLKEAKTILKGVVGDDPQTQEARYYLNLITEAEFKKVLKNRDVDLRLIPLYTRIIRVDPHGFKQALERVTGYDLASAALIEPQSDPEPFSLPEGGTQTFQAAVSQLFQNFGIDLKPPKTAFFNDREGMLLVRGTLAELDAMEAAVQELNIAPPQVNIKVRFYEVAEELTASVWSLLSRTNVPGYKAFSVTGVLTQPQLPVFLKAMQSAPGVEFLNEASVTTLSGRQTQVQLVDLKTIATNINPRALGLPGATTNAESREGVYLEGAMSFGPTIDIVPWVTGDAWRIQIHATAAVTDWMGYDEPTHFVSVYVDGKPKSVPFPQPQIKTRRMAASADVSDGQTLVLGSAMDSLDEPPGAKKKRLLAIITPTIIDPAGKRLHKEAELPPK